MPDTQLQPATLLEATSMGDVAAFEQLFRLLNRRVYGLAVRIVVDPALAEDVAHDAWLSVWNNAKSFDATKGSAEGWILSVTHRRAVDFLRSRSSQDKRNDDFAQQEARAIGGADEWALRLDEHAEVAACFEALSVKQREAVSLAYFKGFTYKQVAEQLGATHSAIKTRLRDAMAALRRCMSS
ncbi:sigma-70 family RNA polymerase sigma factor [Corynebacterium gerontici]|uniref:sigma-70 family RNA polymerase sigma factor n=1 Tax=Corynebacterium gerontici TaxID=2079234 RepID=UPI0013DE1AC9|nr:sigma-70 family RNA polymerase sigma factor [Corynebacterium gerontici]